MQGAQTESRFRGIGRYSLSLAFAIARAAERHEVLLALNGLLPDSIDAIREAFSDLLPRENIRVWNSLGPTRELDPANSTRRQIAERIREAFILSLKPDVVLVTSLFEGLGDDAVVSVGTFDAKTPTAVILYDLIPLLNPDIHFRSSPLRQDYYARKIDSLKRSSQLLAISDSARGEALRGLAFDPDDVINISGACDESFRKIAISDEARQRIRTKFNIPHEFLLYTGGADERKNLARLVSAYAGLPANVRANHRLVMAGRMPEGEVAALQTRAAEAGLGTDEVVFTGYISDEELLALYNICKLFVFPSTHEGFGIPPLEAMSCGAAVIVANSTSLPEVIGSAQAMFDPESIESIRAKMLQALTDPTLREALQRNAAVQATAFSWDRSARRALEALEKFNDRSTTASKSLARVERTTIFQPSSKRILLLKLDHLGDLILAMPAITKLAARYPDAKLELAVGSWNVELAKMFPFFDKIHALDYFKKKSANQASVAQEELSTFLSKLGAYDIALDLRRQSDTRFVLKAVDAKLKVGYQTFDPAIDKELDIALNAVADAPFVETSMNRTSISNQLLALVDALPADPNDYIALPRLFDSTERKKGVIALFPYAGNDVKEWDVERFQSLISKLDAQDGVSAINIFLASATEAQKHVFQGSHKVVQHVGLSIPVLMETLAQNSVCIANNSGGAHLASYLGLTVIGVYGGHETAAEWAPVFPKSLVIHRDAECSPCHIATRADCKYQLFCLSDISVDDVYALAIEAALSAEVSVPEPKLTSKAITNDLIGALKPLLENQSDEQTESIARCIVSSIRPTHFTARIFVDISELVLRDSKTGIQRVTRSILKELLEMAPSGFEILPIYATSDKQGYFAARAFLSHAAGDEARPDAQDDPIDFYAGDIFLGLDFQPQVIPAQKAVLDSMHRAGVKVIFVVYDLLCIQMPQHFVAGTFKGFEQWLDVIAGYDGALCISRSVAADLSAYMQSKHPSRAKRFDVQWFHIGADIESSSPTKGIPSSSEWILKSLRARPSFLSVGTVEPRKGHTQTLDAFELLWAQGADVNLAIVGKEGWLVDKLAERLRHHPESGKRLFWLESTSDEYLERIYATSTCLIAASEGEGFGLPLIEAARHRIPIIARDLAVFQEVAGQNAHYFHGNSAQALADAIRSWTDLFKERTHPKSDTMPWLTWRQTTQDLLKLVCRPHAGAPPSPRSGSAYPVIHCKPT
ncbi:glycosyltransferase [Variovorax sp. J22P271]|uniref:glycosyltransferase n=1 Tax=Variovorax davisae TaxID=3053515 RepID=UPI0025770C10|nr:glycosyltransferase [Variovorax sp. J22P271]MDM0033315.1 glycosyltransferase [Variovorax sp. J22P271]